MTIGQQQQQHTYIFFFFIQLIGDLLILHVMHIDIDVYIYVNIIYIAIVQLKVNDPNLPSSDQQ